MSDTKEILKTPGRIRSLKSYNITNLDESDSRSLDWKNSSFSRVGSIKGSSSIIHCILQSLLSRNAEESKEGKIKIVEKFRKEISDSVSFDKFRKSALILCIKSKVIQYPTVKYICDKLRELNIEHTKDEALFESAAYQTFITYVKEYNNKVDEEILEFVCENININVYIVDIEGNMKYSMLGSDRDLCIVLMKNGDDYEIIGKSKLILYFEKTDEFIKGLK